MTLLADLIKKRESRVIATATPATPATKVAKVAKVARVNPQIDHIPEPDKAEKLHELSLLIEYVAEANDFTESDLYEARFHANKDRENALISFRALAQTIRRDRVMELLQASPESLRAIHIDSDSDPKNIILTTALRHVAIFEMVVSRSRYDAWKMLNILDGLVH